MSTLLDCPNMLKPSVMVTDPRDGIRLRLTLVVELSGGKLIFHIFAALAEFAALWGNQDVQ
jgi:hypothetical protein